MLSGQQAIANEHRSIQALYRVAPMRARSIVPSTLDYRARLAGLYAPRRQEVGRDVRAVPAGTPRSVLATSMLDQLLDELVASRSQAIDAQRGMTTASAICARDEANGSAHAIRTGTS